MHQYRIYTFRDDGHFSAVQRLEYTDEREAAQKAQQLVSSQDSELWESDHLIARFAAPQKTTKQVPVGGGSVPTLPNGVVDIQPPGDEVHSF
jgi:hypothetical protein